MATNPVKSVMDKAMRDESFLDNVRSNPEEALEDYDLSEEETDAILSGEAFDSDPVAEASGQQMASAPLIILVIVIINK